MRPAAPRWVSAAGDSALLSGEGGREGGGHRPGFVRHDSRGRVGKREGLETGGKGGRAESGALKMQKARKGDGRKGMSGEELGAEG